MTTRSGVSLQADLFPSRAGCLVLQQAAFFMGNFAREFSAPVDCDSRRRTSTCASCSCLEFARQATGPRWTGKSRLPCSFLASFARKGSRDPTLIRSVTTLRLVRTDYSTTEGLALVEREKRPVKPDGQVSIKPKSNLAPFFKYEHELTSCSHTRGSTLVFGGSSALRIPESTSDQE
jgi:hypothetical protein